MADPGASPTVLVADDDPLVRTVLRMALAGMGLEVVEARSSDEIASIDAERPLALAVLDLNMPGGGVESNLAALAARTPRPRVLLLSGEDAPPTLAGVDAFARKPIELASLQELVSRLLGDRGEGAERG